MTFCLAKGLHSMVWKTTVATSRIGRDRKRGYFRSTFVQHHSRLPFLALTFPPL